MEPALSRRLIDSLRHQPALELVARVEMVTQFPTLFDWRLRCGLIAIPDRVREGGTHMYKSSFIASAVFSAFVSIRRIGTLAPWLIGPILSALVGTTLMDLWFSAWSEWREKGIAVGIMATLVASGILGEIFGSRLFIRYDFQGAPWSYVHSNGTATPPSILTAVIYAAVDVVIVMIAASIPASPLIVWKTRGKGSAKGEGAKAAGEATPRGRSGPAFSPNCQRRVVGIDEYLGSELATEIAHPCLGPHQSSVLPAADHRGRPHEIFRLARPRQPIRKHRRQKNQGNQVGLVPSRDIGRWAPLRSCARRPGTTKAPPRHIPAAIKTS